MSDIRLKGFGDTISSELSLTLQDIKDRELAEEYILSNLTGASNDKIILPKVSVVDTAPTGTVSTFPFSMNGNPTDVKNNITGELYGTAYIDGKGLNVSNENNYINMGSYPAFNLGTSDWTISLWVNHEIEPLTDVNYTYLAKHDNADAWTQAEHNWMFKYRNGLRFSTFQESTSEGMVQQASNTSIKGLHHVAFVCSYNNYINIYIDGVECSYDLSYTKWYDLTNTLPLYIGAHQDTTSESSGSVEQMIGTIDDIRIWSDVKTPTEIAAIYTEGLNYGYSKTAKYQLADYTFDEKITGNTSIVKVSDVKTAISTNNKVVTEADIPSGGGGSAVSENINQSSHGLTVNTPVRWDSNLLVPAQADDITHATMVGVVTSVIDVDNFTVTYSGIIDTSFDKGKLIWLDIAATQLTDTKPTYDVGNVCVYVGTVIDTGLLLNIDIRNIYGDGTGEIEVMQKIKSITLTTATSNVVVADDLDGDADKLYQLRAKININTTATGSVYLHFNNDTDTHYNLRYLDNGNTGSTTDNTGCDIAYFDNSGTHCETMVQISPVTGTYRSTSSTINGYRFNDTSIISSANGVNTWNNTVDNITKIDISAPSTDGFGVGSYFELWALRKIPIVTPSVKLPNIDRISNNGHNSVFILANNKIYSTAGTADNYPRCTTGRSSTADPVNVSLESFREIYFPEQGTIKDIGGGYKTFAYALFENGNLYTWGNNDKGQCGLGHTSIVSAPALTATNVIEVYSDASNGSYDVIGNKLVIKKTDGYLYSTGANGHGELGVGDTDNRNTWTQVLNSSGTTRVFNKGASIGCLVFQTQDDKIWICGYNGVGSLGTGNTTNVSTPTDVTSAWGGGTGWTIEYVGGSFGYYDTSVHTTTTNIMMLSNGTNKQIMTCGDNSYGSIGDGSTNNTSTPYQVYSGTGLVDITSKGGICSTHYLLSDGTVYGWGCNIDGAVGDGTTNTTVNSPTLIMSNAYKFHTEGTTCQLYGHKVSMCIEDTLGEIYTIGHNTSGSAGIGTAAGCYSPTKIKLDEGIKYIVTFTTNNMTYTRIFVTDDNKIYACGYNSDNAIIQDTATDIHIPLNINTGIYPW